MKKITFLTSLIFCLFLLVSCGSENTGENGTFYTIIYDNPENLDPQMAEDTNSLSVLNNIFEGLTEINESGEVVCSAAENMTVSEDKCTYTFYLRKGIYWYSAGGFSAEVKAKDYVYAMRRIFDPDTMSPYVDEFSSIKNSSEVYDGIMSQTDLGVKALDEYTVQFTLSNPDSDFLYLLSTPAAYPCSEEFFLSTKGRYGLSAEFTAGNGAFYLTEWNYDPYWNENFLSLKKAAKNSTEDRKTYPAYVNYVIADSIEEYEEVSGNSVNVYTTDDRNKTKTRGKTEGIYPCVCTGIVFNPDDEYFSRDDVKKAIISLLDTSVFEGECSDGIFPAYTLLPNAVTFEGQSLNDLLGVYERDSEKGTLENAPEQYSIIVSENFPDAAIVYMLTQNTVLSCDIEILPDEEFEERYNNGEYNMALVSVSSNSSSAVEFLKEYEKFITGSDDLQLFEDYLNYAKKSSSASDTLHNISMAESLVTDSGYFCPVFYESKFLITDNDVSGVIYNPFSEMIDFKYAKIS